MTPQIMITFFTYVQVKAIHLCLFKASGPNSVYVTEDFSRRVRKHREALLAFARELRDR